MKIRCDVCDRAQATVFCSADEAALCDGCDHRVHHANKLASKHMRFSLLHPSFKEAPLCDICQERRALLFCQEDRAILCRECDLPIHKANELTQKHNRFLLTGVKLSASSSLYPTSSSSNSCNTNIKSTSKRVADPSLKKLSPVSNETFSSPSVERTSPSTTYNGDDNLVGLDVSNSSSSISEYLENLPGWRVDDFLDSSLTGNGFCQTFHHSWPLEDQDLESDISSSFPETLPFWVPQGSPQSPHFPMDLSRATVGNRCKESKEFKNLTNSREWSDTDSFSTVPRINPL